MQYISQVTHYLDVTEARKLAIELLTAADDAERKTAKIQAEVLERGERQPDEADAFHVRIHNFGRTIGAWATRTEVKRNTAPL